MKLCLFNTMTDRIPNPKSLGLSSSPNLVSEAAILGLGSPGPPRKHRQALTCCPSNWLWHRNKGRDICCFAGCNFLSNQSPFEFTSKIHFLKNAILGREKNGEWQLHGYGVSFWHDEEVLEWDRADSCTTLGIYYVSLYRMSLNGWLCVVRISPQKN